MAEPGEAWSPRRTRCKASEALSYSSSLQSLPYFLLPLLPC